MMIEYTLYTFFARMTLSMYISGLVGRIQERIVPMIVNGEMRRI